MPRQFKVVRCPQCTHNVQLPVRMDRYICPCRNKIILHLTQDDGVVDIPDTADRIDGNCLDARSTLQENFPNGVHLSPALQVLKVLRNYRADCPQWFSIHKVYYYCIMAGLLPDEVRETIDTLTAEGFIEKKEDAIRAIPVN